MRLISTAIVEDARIELCMPLDTDFFSDITVEENNLLSFKFDTAAVKAAFPFVAGEAFCVATITGSGVYVSCGVYADVDLSSSCNEYISDGLVEFEIEFSEEETKKLLLFLVKKLMKT